MNLALFDFDGTITRKDTFTRFMRYALPKHRLLSGYMLILPDVIKYYSGHLHGSKVRQKICKIAFTDQSLAVVEKQANVYANTVIPKYVRANALKQLNWHKDRGDKVVVVSASLDLYLKFWCKNNGVELICSEIESKNGKLTGGYASKDCSSEEKRQRVLARFNLDEYDKVYAYGDTVEDNELLEMADERYYRYF